LQLSLKLHRQQHGRGAHINNNGQVTENSFSLQRISVTLCSNKILPVLDCGCQLTRVDLYNIHKIVAILPFLTLKRIFLYFNVFTPVGTGTCSSVLAPIFHANLALVFSLHMFRKRTFPDKWRRRFYMLDALPVTQPTASK